MKERDEIFLKGSGAMFFQGLFIACSGSVSGCEPVLLTKMSKFFFKKKRERKL